MSYEELAKLRESTKADPSNNILFYSSIYERKKQIGHYEIKSTKNINELNAWLTYKLNLVTGGHYENLSFFNEYGDYTNKLKLFGSSLYSVINEIKGSYPKTVKLPRFRSANRIYIPGPWKTKFMNYNSDAAFLHTKIAHYMNLRSSSYYAKINGTGLRLYFSPDANGPLCGSNYNVLPCDKKPQPVNLGNIILPAKLARKICGQDIVKIKIPDTPQDAIDLGIKNGMLHPNYSIPMPSSEIIKNRIKNLEFRPSQGVYDYLVRAGIKAMFERESIFVTDKELGPILEAVLDGKLDGVKMPSGYIDHIEIIEQKNGWHDLNRYHGIMQVIYKDNKPFLPETVLRYCAKCQRSTPFRRCEQCGSKTERLYFCRNCGKPTVSQTCPNCGLTTTLLTTRDVELSTSIELASRKLNLDVHHDIVFPERGVGEIEDIRKPLLRRRAAIMTSKCGISVIFTTAEIADLDPSEVIIPHRLSSSLLEVARFIDMEIEEIYGGKRIFASYSPEQLVEKNLILLNHDLSAGIKVKVKDIGRSGNVLVNQGILSLLGLGLRNIGFYVSLESDVILNYSGKYCKPARYLNIYNPNLRKTMPKINIDYLAASSKENIVDLSKSLIQLISLLKDKKGAMPQLVKTLILIEKIYNNQMHVCSKCGIRFTLPPISYRCPKCGLKLSPEFDTEMLNSIIISLSNIVEMLENDEREEIEIIIERFQSIFKSNNQLSLSEFS